MRNSLLVILALLIASPAIGQEIPGLPLRPVSKLLAQQGAPSAQEVADKAARDLAVKMKGEKAPDTALEPAIETKDTIVVVPGVNTLIPVSKNHLNRLLTPFETPLVKTVSNAQVNVEGTIVYVAATDEAPVTLFISDRDDQEKAMSLSLLPRAIPPRELKLQFEAPGGASPGVDFSRAKASKWELDESYTEVLRKTLDSVAKGQVPSGYGIRDYNSSDYVLQCSEAGFHAAARQVLEGSNMQVLVALLTNVDSVAREFDEASCYSDRVLAVAAWPELVLAPNQSSELYVIVRRPTPEEQQIKRPSLLN